MAYKLPYNRARKVLARRLERELDHEVTKASFFDALQELDTSPGSCNLKDFFEKEL